MAAADDPVGTVRRMRQGFSHLIKFDQGSRTQCWDFYDTYGSCGSLFGYNELLTNDEVDAMDAPVVYVPDPNWGQ